MADYNIKAEITADASGFESGIKKAQKASKNLSSTISNVVKGLGKNGLVGALGAVGLASSGLSATLGTVVKVARKVSETMAECTSSYKTQLIAERSLDTAIRNNPFVTGASSKALKQFASEMQKVSNYGDEQLIPMMTNLVSLGRTETETMQIMSVAMDMSAGMGISLDTAITQLNATLNGNIGRLGQQNAELKGLTEEELKQGKAIEILGEKFKGLSSATADTSKQLKNIKGDFKEALGQFTLPSSDMWNKFWSGFYENGIKIITKLSDYIDANIVGKKVYNAMTANADIVAQAQGLSREEVLSDFRYLKEQLKNLNDEELKAYQNYLANLKTRTTGEERMLTISKQILQSRGLQEIQEKKEAEASAKKAKEAETQAQKEKELAETNIKTLKLESEWQDKLFAQRIEQLERARDSELENEKLTEEEKNKIREFYMQQIVIMKVAQLEKERDEILSNEELTEQTRLAVINFYSNKIQNVKQDEAKKLVEIKKDEKSEEEKIEKQSLEVVVKLVQESTKRIGDAFKKVASTIKNIFSKIGNVFTSVVQFSPDDALNNLLKFEDMVLTFFAETLPKLPAFFSSAVESIIKTIGSILGSINFNDISGIFESIIGSIGKLITSIAQYINQNGNTIASGLSKVVSSIIQSIANWIASGGWKELLKAILTIQKALEKVVTENMGTLVDTIIAMLPDLINTLIESIVSASQTLGKLMKPILKLIVKLIEAIIEIAFSDEVLDASMGVIEDFIQAIIEVIIQDLPKILPKLVIKLIKVVIRTLASFPIEIAKAFMNGLGKAFANTEWGQVVWDMLQGLVDAVKELLGEDLFNNISNFFSNLWTSIINGADWAVKQIYNGFEWAVNGIKGFFSGLADNVKAIFESIGNGIKWAINGIIDTVNWAINGINSVTQYVGIRLGNIPRLANGTNNAQKGLTLVGEAGPELVRFNGGEQVLNTRNTQKALEGAGKGSNTFNVTFNNLQDTTAYAMMQQLRGYNKQMAINGVI